MKLSINNFHNYENSNCPTIKKILIWVEEKGEFTYKELRENFNEASGLHYVKKYLKPEFFNELLLTEFKEFHESNYTTLNSYLEKLDELNEFKNTDLQCLNEKIIEYKKWKSTSDVTYLIDKMYYGKYSCGSYCVERKFNPAMSNFLYSLIASIEFKEGDFKHIKSLRGYRGWFSENFVYQKIIQNKNGSAIRAFEKDFEWKPFVINGKRLYDNIRIRFVDDNKWIYLRCTVFEPTEDKIRFVSDNFQQEKQQRFAFNRKTFKEFFNNKIIEIL